MERMLNGKCEKEVIINNRKGLHTRAAAIVSFKASQLNKKYGVNLLVQRKKKGNKVPIASMLALTTLGVRFGDKVIISCKGENGYQDALLEMELLLSGQIEVENIEMDEIDRVLDINTITSEKLIDSLVNGVVIVNEDDIVVLFNKAAERITGISKDEIIGRKASDIIENSQLHIVLNTGENLLENKQRIKNTTIITNTSPILVDNKIIGATAIFQDISEVERLSNTLDSVVEIKERLANILDFANDGICMVDEEGYISYINPEYEKIWGISCTEVLGRSIKDICFNSALIKAFKTGYKQLDVIDIREDGIRILSNASPIIIDKSFKGIVSISKEITELHKVMDRLKKAEEKIEYFTEELNRKHSIHQAFNIIVGKSGALEDVLAIASKAAKTSATVVIYGESGTGKEYFARAINGASLRKDKPFIRLNCAAIPENLLESELFGHVKGAFTGAIKDKFGKFELANGGTIFLDEIGDISKEMQVKLLRVLQEKEFEKVGGTQNIKVDVRVIAATNRNLQKMVESGEFRKDLYYRLNVIPITLPPLRDRKGDIPLLVEHFVNKMKKREGIKIDGVTPKVMEYLENYTWPGNIRELENIIERAVALNEGNILKEDCLPNYIKLPEKATNVDLINLINGELTTFEQYEKAIIKKGLEKYKSYNKVGKVLGITHRTVALKAQKYNLN